MPHFKPMMNLLMEWGGRCAQKTAMRGSAAENRPQAAVGAQ